MKKRLLSSLLVLCMVLTLMPAFSVPAEAASEDYVLLLNSTDGKFYKNSSSGDEVTPAGASVSGVAGAWVLTLTDFNFETTASSALTVPTGTTIKLVGDNAITSKYSGEAIPCGIYGAGTLSIDGTGTLHATGGTSTASDSNGIRANTSITISGSVTITATGGTAEKNSLGIYVHNSGDLTIKGSSTVTAQGGTAEVGSYGLYSGSLTTSDSASVTASGGSAATANSIGIRANNNITISDTAIVTAHSSESGGGGYSFYLHNDDSTLLINGSAAVTTTGDTAATSIYGIRTANLTISGSAVLTAASGTATETNSVGIRVSGDLKVSGNATLNATSGTAGNASYGLFANNTTIEDKAKVTATGGAATNASVGFYKSDGTIYINDDATLTAASGAAPKSCYGIYMSNVGLTVNGGTVTATGNTRAIYPDYPAPRGSTYYVNTAVSPSTTPLKGEGALTVIGSTHRYAKLVVDPDLVISIPFTDVNTSDWFFSAVKYTYDNKLMNGTSDTLFSPSSNLTRAMLVTLLYRYEGEPAVTASNPFSDVQSGQWYTNAIIWASENKIVNGYGDGKFGPNDNVTREQVAAVLYRYADWKKLDVSKTNALTSYTDSAEISSWALDAMKWANAEGLMSGRTPTTLVPKGTMNRAEVATILMRFIEDFVK